MPQINAEPRLDAVQKYAGAKCRRDAAAAMSACHDDFVLDVATLGLRVAGKAAVSEQLEAFFKTFPDYGADIEGRVVGDDAIVFWCTERGTMRGPMLGIAPTGRSASFPTVSIYTFKGDLLAGERWFFSLASMCDQLNLSLDAVVAARDALFRNGGTVG